MRVTRVKKYKKLRYKRYRNYILYWLVLPSTSVLIGYILTTLVILPTMTK
ncbi:MAG: hypothetical protein N2645_02060 [Clostridia bacterium]|nr:hypothetical protein [Clostridia bacterium]